jgi:hypothetical protein
VDDKRAHVLRGREPISSRSASRAPAFGAAVVKRNVPSCAMDTPAVAAGAFAAAAGNGNQLTGRSVGA